MKIDILYQENLKKMKNDYIEKEKKIENIVLKVKFLMMQ